MGQHPVGGVPDQPKPLPRIYWAVARVKGQAHGLLGPALGNNRAILAEIIAKGDMKIKAALQIDLGRHQMWFV
ncbi:MAG: hypothetical protein ACO37E_10090 [Lutimaribacter sp.]